MVDYGKGIIYQITNNVDDEIYVGSTCAKLSDRFYRHKQASKKMTYKIYQHVDNNGGWDNYDIELIEMFPCENKDELHKREKYWIKELGATLNSLIPTRTPKEWKEDNKEKWQKYMKEYKEENKEKLLEQNRVRASEYYEKNKDEINEKRRQQYDDPDYKQKLKEQQKKYREENKEKLKLKQKEAYLNRKEQGYYDNN